jgi:hypothetical protein
MKQCSVNVPHSISVFFFPLSIVTDGKCWDFSAMAKIFLSDKKEQKLVL